MNNRPTVSQIKKEVVLTTSRSGGAGGQHVNKVNTKVTLKWDVTHSQVLEEEQKAIIQEKLASRLTNEGVLVLSAENFRSQIKNKEAVFKKLDKLLSRAFYVPKKRKATKPSKKAIQKRLDSKKHQSEKKKWRQKM